MSVNGDYLSKRFRLTATPYIRAYGEWVLHEMLPRIKQLEDRADEVARNEFERLGAEMAMDCDMGWVADKAQAKGLAFYETMGALRQSTLNLFAAGLFHLLEQQLADLCHDAASGESQVSSPKDTKLAVVADWYARHFHLNLRALATWPVVEELRWVANAVKHAEGDSAQKLRERRPELFRDPVLGELRPQGWNEESPLHSPLAGEDFYITEQVFQEYGEAVNRFVDEIAAHFKDHGDDLYP